MKKIDKESNTGKIVRALGIGIGISFALANRRTSYKMTETLVEEVFGVNRKPKNVSYYFLRLRKQKLIEYKKDGDIINIVLTENGRNMCLRFNYDDLKIKSSKVWDRQFRVIVFDIPEKKRNARDSLRDKIKELGFVKFNDSVWVHPFPCQKEIDFIANYWGVGKYVQFILAKEITNRDKLEKVFNL